MKILLLNGVNMNMLGKRNADYYGTDTLAELEQKIIAYAKKRGAEVVCRQSNFEGELVEILQQTDCGAAVLNAGAYSHYSYALRDCIECIDIPVIETHMSDINNREDFRKTDVLKDVSAGYFYGKGLQSYFDAVDFAIKILSRGEQI